MDRLRRLQTGMRRTQVNDPIQGADGCTRRLRMARILAKGCFSGSSSNPDLKLLELPREVRDLVLAHALIPEVTVKVDTTDLNACAPLMVDFTYQALVTNVLEPLLVDAPPDTDVNALTRQQLKLMQQTSIAPIAILRDAPATNVLRLSKQLNDEYMREAYRRMTLVLKDTDMYGFTPFALPRAVMDHVRHVELHLAFFCSHRHPVYTHNSAIDCRAVLEATQHCAWIGPLLAAMPNLRDLAVHGYLAMDDFCECVIPVGMQHRMSCQAFVPAISSTLLKYMPPQIKKLTIGRYNYAAAPGLDGFVKPLYEWTPASGEIFAKPSRAPEQPPQRAKADDPLD